MPSTLSLPQVNSYSSDCSPSEVTGTPWRRSRALGTRRATSTVKWSWNFEPKDFTRTANQWRC